MLHKLKNGQSSARIVGSFGIRMASVVSDAISKRLFRFDVSYIVNFLRNGYFKFDSTSASLKRNKA